MALFRVIDSPGLSKELLGISCGGTGHVWLEIVLCKLFGTVVIQFVQH